MVCLQIDDKKMHKRTYKRIYLKLLIDQQFLVGTPVSSMQRMFPFCFVNYFIDVTRTHKCRIYLTDKSSEDTQFPCKVTEDIKARKRKHDFLESEQTLYKTLPYFLAYFSLNVHYFH